MGALHRFMISIHALHEESDRWQRDRPSLVRISIHALHEESDLKRRLVEMGVPISIHALHEESDKVFEHLKHGKVNFNPRSP